LPKARNLPQLYPIVDVEVARHAGFEPLALAQAFLAGGARLLQLRAKMLDGAAFLALATAIVDAAHRVGAEVVVNDRADIARLARADGIHVGQDDLHPADVRKIVGEDMMIGRSTHTEQQIDAALQEPITYLAIGPVYSTNTKATGYERVGLDAVRVAAARAATAGMPVVAIGGITLDTAPQVIDAGAASVAVITDLVTTDPEARVRDYLRALAL
jgi:thiamine-phosphate pyrophosphorylase